MWRYELPKMTLEKGVRARARPCMCVCVSETERRWRRGGWSRERRMGGRVEWVREKERDRLAIKGSCEVWMSVRGFDGSFIAAPKQRRDFFTIRRNIVAETLNFYPPQRQRRAGSRLCLATGGSTPVHARIQRSSTSFGYTFLSTQRGNPWLLCLFRKVGEWRPTCTELEVSIIVEANTSSRLAGLALALARAAVSALVTMSGIPLLSELG